MWNVWYVNAVPGERAGGFAVLARRPETGPFLEVATLQWNNSFSLIPWGANFPIVTMALRECKECGRSVSTTAPSCPQCGAADPTGETRQKSNIVGAWVLVAILAIFSLFSVYIHNQQNEMIDEYFEMTTRLVAQRDSLVTICSRRVGGRGVARGVIL